MPAAVPEFVHHCLDLLAPVAPCVARRMFGGWGLSTEGLTLAIIADLGDGERLWLKADAPTVAAFEAAGCRPFVYLAKGKPMAMGYRSAPDEAMESPALMRPWARLALDAAVRAHAAKGTRTARATQTPKTQKNPKP